MTPDRSMGRRRYIDWARGLAVLLMIEAHTFDAWTRPDVRHSIPFQYAGVLGGFAAPLFLWLAGVSAAFSATSITRRTGSRTAGLEALCRRGLEIFVLAFLFRLQAFIVSPGSYPVTLFRVDILNIMGPALVATGLVWPLVSTRAGAAAIYAGLACVFAMATPLVRLAPFVDDLPTWMQWYIRPAGDYTTFTLFPWSGFVFAGAGCGALLATVRDASSERRLHIGLALAGLATLVLGFYTASRPSIYQQSSFWTSSPTYFAVRVGVLMTALAALYALSAGLSEATTPLGRLQRLGQHSLFVYWIHVELVYGYATWPLRRHLPVWGTFVAFVAFTVLMYGVVVARDRLVQAMRERRQQAPALGNQPIGRSVQF